MKGKSLSFLARSNNLLDWEVIHLTGAVDVGINNINCSKAGDPPHLLVSGYPGRMISAVEGADLHGLPFKGLPIPQSEA
jgi:hypothetical protein